MRLQSRKAAALKRERERESLKHSYLIHRKYQYILKDFLINYRVFAKVWKLMFHVFLIIPCIVPELIFTRNHFHFYRHCLCKYRYWECAKIFRIQYKPKLYTNENPPCNSRLYRKNKVSMSMWWCFKRSSCRWRWI